MNYSRNKLELGLNLRFNGRKKVEDFNISEGIDRIELTPEVDPSAINLRDQFYGSPSWVTLNASTNYRLTNNLNFRVVVENIFDQHYIEFASAISAPGRNFSFGLSANF